MTHAELYEISNRVVRRLVELGHLPDDPGEPLRLDLTRLLRKYIPVPQ